MIEWSNSCMYKKKKNIWELVNINVNNGRGIRIRIIFLLALLKRLSDANCSLKPDVVFCLTYK